MADNDREKNPDEILKKVPPEEDITLSRKLVDLFIDSIREMLVPQAVEVAVSNLADETGDTREDVLLKALSLYEAAIEARHKGQRLVLVGPDYQFIREIVGFERSAPSPAEREMVAG